VFRGGLSVEATGVPAVVENDVNLMTLYEATWTPGANDHFMFIEMGTWMGSGVTLDGHLYPGADGASCFLCEGHGSVVSIQK